MTEILSQLKPDSRFFIVLMFAIAVSSVEVIALYHLKKRKMEISLICYFIIALLLTKAYEYEGIGHMNLMCSTVSIMLSYTIGNIYFGEPVNKYTYLAIIFALLAIYFAHLSDE